MEQAVTHLIGIDPGVTGAMCVMRLEDPRSCFYFPFPLSETRKENKRKNKKGESSKGAFRTERTYDLRKLRSLFKFPEPMKPFAIIEQVSAMPRDGSVQAFKFGNCYGQLLGLLAAFQIPVVGVRPGDWIRAMVPGRQDKKDHVRAAERLLAEHGVVGWQDARITDGEADAILLAEYGRRRVIAGLKGSGDEVTERGKPT